LTDAGDNRRQSEGPWVRYALEKKLKLLVRAQGKRILVLGGVKGSHKTHDPLLFLLL
jgi:hypothetical protein